MSAFDRLFGSSAGLFDAGFSTKGGVTVVSRLPNGTVSTSFTPSRDSERMVDARTSVRQPFLNEKLAVEGTMNHAGEVSATLSSKNLFLKGLGMRALLEPSKRPVLSAAYQNDYICTDMEGTPFTHARVSAVFNLPDSPLENLAFGAETMVDKQLRTPLYTLRTGLTYSFPGSYVASCLLEDRFRKSVLSFVHPRTLACGATLTTGVRYSRHLLPNTDAAEVPKEGEPAPEPLYVENNVEFGVMHKQGARTCKAKIDLTGSLNLSWSRRFLEHMTVSVGVATTALRCAKNCCSAHASPAPCCGPKQPIASIGLSLLFD